MRSISSQYPYYYCRQDSRPESIVLCFNFKEYRCVLYAFGEIRSGQTRTSSKKKKKNKRQTSKYTVG